MSLNSVLNSLKISTQWQRAVRAAHLTQKPARSLDLIGALAMMNNFSFQKMLPNTNLFLKKHMS